MAQALRDLLLGGLPLAALLCLALWHNVQRVEQARELAPVRVQCPAGFQPSRQRPGWCWRKRGAGAPPAGSVRTTVSDRPEITA